MLRFDSLITALVSASLLCAGLASCSSSSSSSAATDTLSDTASSDTTIADTSGSDAGSDTAGDTSPVDSSGDTASEVSGCAFTPAATASSLVINEIEGKGDDWVELRNNGTTTMDLSGMIVADRDDTGCARLAEAVTFPSGTKLAPSDYLLIVGGKKTPGEGVQTKCLATGPTSCYQAAFKVSAAAGDTIFLISGKSILDSAPLPAGVLAAITQSWGRVPNGSGPFQLASPTPGAANQP